MIAIWGANSFIGRHLTHALDAKGVALKLFARQFDGFPFEIQSSPQRVTADFTNPDSYIQALSDCKTIILLISASRVATFANAPEREKLENVNPYQSFLDRLPHCGICPDHLIYLSSGGTVYGVTEQAPVNENHVTSPISPYGQAKLEIETQVTSFTARTGCPSTILRVANPIGIWNKNGGLVDAALHCAKTDTPMTLWGTGNQIRDYFDVRELAQCIAQITENIPKTTALYNVGSGQGHSINQMIDTVEQLLRTPIKRLYLADRPFDVPYSVLDCTRVYKDIGWTAKRTPREIMKEMLETL